jgi:hypothetical protein
MSLMLANCFGWKGNFRKGPIIGGSGASVGASLSSDGNAECTKYQAPSACTSRSVPNPSADGRFFDER